MANYTVRNNTRQIDVAITGGPGNETWTVTAAPPFGSGHFQETGSGSKTLTGPIIDGRDYRLIVDPIDGYDWGPISDVTAGITPQTFTVAMSADVPLGDLTITLSGPGSGQGWTVTGPSYPTGYSGNGSDVLSDITQGDYDIVYDDDDISLTSPPPDSLTLGTSAEFTGTYTTRNTFVVDVCVTDDGGTPTGAFGSWEIVNADGFGLSDFTATGDWDTNNNPVNPSAGDFYEGREYTLTFTPEVGYDPVAPITITVTGTFVGAYLTSQAGACDSFVADVTASGSRDWSSTYALTPASATTGTADFYLKPSALGMDASILFGKTATIDTYDHPVEIRFNPSSRIDVSNAVGYCSGGGNPLCTTDVSYEADHWYHFVVDFDVANQLCTVQVEDCNDGLVVLEQSADFRSQSAPNDDQIGYWAITTWSNVGSLALYTGNGNTDMEWTSGGGGTPPPTDGDITVNVSPQTASWTLTGPSAYSYNGTGTETQTSLTFGDYDLTYHPLSGYNAPGPASVTLSVANTPHTFYGTYQATGTQGKSLYGIGHSLLGKYVGGDMGDILMLTMRVVEWAGHSMTTDEQNIPGASLQWNWDPALNGGVTKGREDLASGAWNAMIMTPNNGDMLGDPTSAGNSSGEHWASLWRDAALAGWTGTPECETYFFTHWNERSGTVDYDGGTDPDQTWRNAFPTYQTFGDVLVSAVNANNPISPPLVHIPLGPVYMAALYDEIYKQGGSPIQTAGLTKINDIFKQTDPGGNPVAGDRVHLGYIGRYYQALVFAAHIFGIDVRGANISFASRFGPDPYPDLLPVPTQDQMTALQNLVHSTWSQL